MDSTDYAIVVEAKAQKHKDAVDEVQFYMSENTIKKTKDIIGIAVSGQTIETLKLSYFYLLKGTEKIEKFAGKALLPLTSINEKFLNAKNGDVVSDEELSSILTSLNKKFHDNKVRDTDRSLFFSGIMIALNNSNFRNTYKSIQEPSEEEQNSAGSVLLSAHHLNSAILNAVESELKGKINNLSKEFSWKDRFAFIKTIDIPLLEYKEIVEMVEKKIFNPFRKNEKLDILGRAYKIFLKRAGKVDNKNIILTPDHVKQLMVKLARLSKDDVVLDTCTGSGGFLMEAMETMIKLSGDDETKIKNIKEKQLIGFETDSVLFALACSNMFLHKDGRTNMLFRSSLLDVSKREDKTVFDYIKSLKPTKVIINPPYESGNPIRFTIQALNYLEPNGKLIIIMPNPTLSQNEDALTPEILDMAKLDFVIKMPMSIFKEQKRTVYTSIFGFTKTPHQKTDDVVFYELKEDGLVSVQHKGRIDKYKRWPAIEADIVDSVFNKKEKAGVCECRKIYMGDELVCAGVRESTLLLPNIVKFGDLFDTSVNGTLQSEDAESEGEYDFITAAEKWKKHTSYKHDMEAIVYAVGAEGSLGRAHYVNGKFIAATLCLVLTAKNPDKYPVDLEFYSYYLMAIRKKLVTALKNGTSKLTINAEQLANYPIEYIEYSEQIRLKPIIKARLKAIEKMEKKLNDEKEKAYDGLSNM